MYNFYCFQCDVVTEYTKEEVEYNRKILKDGGGVWWKCPNCGIKVYFEEVYLRAKRGVLF